MHDIRLEKTLPYTPDQLLQMVLDVERYGEFVPFCEQVAVRERMDRGGREVMIAAMTVGVSIFNETFVSRVIADRSARTIRVTSIDGPLRALVNDWEITPVSAPGFEGAKIDFHVCFEFKSRMLAILADKRVEAVCLRIMDAFVERAHVLYSESADAASVVSQAR